MLNVIYNQFNYNMHRIQEFCIRLPIIVFTNHENKNFNGLNASDRNFRWLLLLEEYAIIFGYLPRKKNVFVADALSRLHIDSLKIQEEYVIRICNNTSLRNRK
jgi:hypothetical protein